MASRRLREKPRHKLRLKSCYLSAEILASLRFVCIRTDDAMLNDAHFDVVHVTTKWVSRLVLDHAIAAIQTSR